MSIRENLQKDILLQLKTIFESEDFSVIYTDKNEEMPIDILSVLLPELSSEELMAEFCFLDSASPEENVLSFTSSLHISEDLPEESIYPLYIALSEINWVLPYGAFVMNGTDLIYKYTAIIPGELDKDQILDLCETAAGQTIVYGSTFADLFDNLAATLDLDTFRTELDQILGKES